MKNVDTFIHYIIWILPPLFDSKFTFFVRTQWQLLSVCKSPPHYHGCGGRPPLFDCVSYSHVGWWGVDVFPWWSSDEDGRRTWGGLSWICPWRGSALCSTEGENESEISAGEDTHWLLLDMCHIYLCIVSPHTVALYSQQPTKTGSSMLNPFNKETMLFTYTIFSSCYLNSFLSSHVIYSL